jgi:hypothetical protein
LGIERCGKINSVNSVAESWTGIGVVAAFVAGAFMVPWPRLKMIDSIYESHFHKYYNNLEKIAKLATSLIIDCGPKDIQIELISIYGMLGL